MIEKSKGSRPVCQECKKRGATKTSLLGVPLCDTCYKKQEKTSENLFQES